MKDNSDIKWPMKKQLEKYTTEKIVAKLYSELIREKLKLFVY